MERKMTSKLGLWIFALGMLILSGCGDGRPSRVKVSGVVRIDGQPLEQGTVKFIPEGARASLAKIQEDGRFTLTCYDGDDGIVPGTHRVSVVSNEQVGAAKMKWLIPKKYSDHRVSGIEYTIEEDKEDLEIELTWDGGKPYVTQSRR